MHIIILYINIGVLILNSLIHSILPASIHISTISIFI